MLNAAQIEKFFKLFDRLVKALEKIAEEPKDTDNGPRIRGFGGES